MNRRSRILAGSAFLLVTWTGAGALPAAADPNSGISFEVAADGTPHTVSLEAGDYVVTVSGTYQYGPSADHIADAEYDYAHAACGDREASLLDLVINDQDVDWGPCDPATYSYATRWTCIVTCDLTFRISDSYYLDNAGALEVMVTAVGDAIVPNLRTQPNSDGGLNVYDDHNHNFAQDADEATLAILPKTAQHLPVDGLGAAHTLPAVSTPAIDSRPVTTPPVVLPATCTAPACHSPTPVSGPPLTTPVVPSIPITTPPVPVPKTCIQSAVCVEGFTIPPQNVGSTPGLGPQTVPVPAHTVPAACSVAGALCLPPTPVLGPQSEATPAQGPIAITPTIVVAFALAPSAASFGPHLLELDSIGPISIIVPVPFIGDVPITLCPATCPAPVLGKASYHGNLTLRVTVGSTTEERTVPIDVG